MKEARMIHSHTKTTRCVLSPYLFPRRVWGKEGVSIDGGMRGLCNEEVHDAKQGRWGEDSMKEC